MKYETIGLVRLCRFEHPEWVIPEIAQHCDKMIYLTNHLRNNTAVQFAEQHEKTEKIVEAKCEAPGMVALNGELLDLGLRIINDYEPKYVIYFDEDEAPPARFESEFELFKKSEAQMMLFRFVFTWGDPKTISMHGRWYFWHSKVLKFVPRMRALPYRGFCVPATLQHAASYRSPYQLRHFPYTLPEMRRAREDDAWKRRDFTFIKAQEGRMKTMPYDPNMTFVQWLRWCGEVHEGDAGAGFWTCWNGTQRLPNAPELLR